MTGETKRCKLCGRELPIEMYWRNGYHNGRIMRKPECRDCCAFRYSLRVYKAQEAGVRTCTVCGQTKPVTEFYVHGKGRRGQCKVCYSVIQMKRHAERKRQHFSERMSSRVVRRAS